MPFPHFEKPDSPTGCDGGNRWAGEVDSCARGKMRRRGSECRLQSTRGLPSPTATHGGCPATAMDPVSSYSASASSSSVFYHHQHY
ncbi:unnamed protein product [Lota lota]